MKNGLPSYLIPVCMCLCPLLLSGCVKFYHYENIAIKVIDPELDQPVENVLVSAEYSCMGGGLFIGKGPKGTPDSTDSKGTAILKVATNALPWGVLGFSFSADGYIPVTLSLPIQSDKDSECVVPLYRRPLPKIECIVPDDYQGPVVIQILHSNELVMGEPGQRLFTYQLQNNGRVNIRITPLFNRHALEYDMSVHRISSDDCRFIVKRENGRSIVRVGREYEQVLEYAGAADAVDPDTIAFRWVCDESSNLLFVIGTEHDRDVLYKKLYPENRNRLDRDAFNAYFREP